MALIGEPCDTIIFFLPAGKGGSSIIDKFDVGKYLSRWQGLVRFAWLPSTDALAPRGATGIVAQFESQGAAVVAVNGMLGRPGVPTIFLERAGIHSIYDFLDRLKIGVNPAMLTKPVQGLFEPLWKVCASFSRKGFWFREEHIILAEECGYAPPSVPEMVTKFDVPVYDVAPNAKKGGREEKDRKMREDQREQDEKIWEEDQRKQDEKKERRDNKCEEDQREDEKQERRERRRKAKARERKMERRRMKEKQKQKKRKHEAPEGVKKRRRTRSTDGKRRRKRRRRMATPSGSDEIHSVGESADARSSEEGKDARRSHAKKKEEPDLRKGILRQRPSSASPDDTDSDDSALPPPGDTDSSSESRASL
eukprot:gene31088-24349_t